MTEAPCCGCPSGYSPIVSWARLQVRAAKRQPFDRWDMQACRCTACHPPHLVEMAIADGTAEKLKELGGGPPASSAPAW